MKCFSRFLPIFLGVSLSISTVAHGQSWSSVLPSSRAINWSTAGLPASLPDGETTTNPWTPPTRTQYGSTISPSGNAATDLSNINTALGNCPNGDYVLLGPGTFQIQGQILLVGHSCTLRGSGAQSTILSLSGSGYIQLGQASGTNYCLLTPGSNYAAGSTSVTCNSLSGSAPATGDIAALVQADSGFTGPCTVVNQVLTCTNGSSADNGGLFVCGYNSTCSTSTGAANNASQYQIDAITSVSNSSGTYTVGLSNPLYMANWSYAQYPVLAWNTPLYNEVGGGLEDFTVYYNGISSENQLISFENTYASWAKGLRVLGAGQDMAVNVVEGVNDLVLNNYIDANINIDSSYQAGLSTTQVSATLMLNNILTYAVEPWEGFGGNSGNVIAYNVGRDAFTSYEFNATYDHHAYDSFDLFEGNEVGEMDEDDTWGTHDLNTYFRNYSTCYDAPYTTYASNAARGVQLGGYQRFDNYIGNAVGTAGQCGTYQSTSTSGVIYSVNTSDPLVASTMYRWGNVSVVQQTTDTPSNSGIRFVSSEVPASLPSAIARLSVSSAPSTTLPCSFFLPGYTSTSCASHPNGGTGLSWWKVCTAWTSFPNSCGASQTQQFPFAGPDVTGGPNVNGHAYNNPAVMAWQNLPVDTTYQKSYAVTSSSWSNGTETLTISGLPGTMHLQGAFQNSGLNSACTSGAAFNSAGEILITGSSSTTVSYALPSNPGTSCTGSFLFPDVRQFDERVYQADPSGTTPIGTPSDLTGNVVPTS